MPLLGRCERDILEVCQGGTIFRTDCHRYDRPASPGIDFDAASCRSNRGTPMCDVPLGSGCIASVGTAGRWSTCQEGGACVFDGRAVCRANLPACTTGEPARCLGNDKLQVACFTGQPLICDCFAMGGTCTSAQCLGLAPGAPSVRRRPDLQNEAHLRHLANLRVNSRARFGRLSRCSASQLSPLPPSWGVALNASRWRASHQSSRASVPPYPSLRLKRRSHA